jgi:hypothetical protein
VEIENMFASLYFNFSPTKSGGGHVDYFPNLTYPNPNQG